MTFLLQSHTCPHLWCDVWELQAYTWKLPTHRLIKVVISRNHKGSRRKTSAGNRSGNHIFSLGNVRYLFYTRGNWTGDRARVCLEAFYGEEGRVWKEKLGSKCVNKTPMLEFQLIEGFPVMWLCIFPSQLSTLLQRISPCNVAVDSLFQL